jgi:hypothetical protein
VTFPNPDSRCTCPTNPNCWLARPGAAHVEEDRHCAAILEIVGLIRAVLVGDCAAFDAVTSLDGEQLRLLLLAALLTNADAVRALGKVTAIDPVVVMDNLRVEQQRRRRLLQRLRARADGGRRHAYH